MEEIIPLLKKYLHGGELYALHNVSKDTREILSLKYINPIKLVFLKMNTCTICDKKDHLIIKTPVACDFREYGWEACDDCRPNCLYSRTKYLLKAACIPYNCVYNYSIFDIRNIRFYYTDNKIYTGSHTCNFGNLFYKDHSDNNIYTVIGALENPVPPWKTMKEIKLQNLIYCNRKLCGYKYTQFPYKFRDTIDFLTKQEFNKRLKDMYNEVNEFYILLLCLHKGNLPKEIKMIIFEYWRNLI